MAPTNDGLSAQQIKVLSAYRQGDPDPICDLFPVTTYFPLIRKAFHAGRVERAIHVSQEAIELHGPAIRKHLNSPITRSIPEGRALAGLVKTIAFLANDFEDDWETKESFRHIANAKILPETMVPPGQWLLDLHFPRDRHDALRRYTQPKHARSARKCLARPKRTAAQAKDSDEHGQGGTVSLPWVLRSHKRRSEDGEASPDRRPIRRTNLPPLQRTKVPVSQRSKSSRRQRRRPRP